MNRYMCITIILLSIFTALFGWETTLLVDGGQPRELSIGMAPSATDGFDRDIDVAAPPVPPVGFYCYIPIADTSHEYLTALWSDFRKPASSAEWEIRLVRPQRPPQVIFTGLPRVGKITINNIEAVEDSLALTFSKSDTVLKVRYSRGFWEEPVANLSFEIKHDAEAIIVIKDPDGKPVRRLPDMFLKAGEQNIGWNATDNRGNKVEPGIYYANIALRWGDETSNFEVQTIVKSNGNENQ